MVTVSPDCVPVLKMSTFCVWPDTCGTVVEPRPAVTFRLAISHVVQSGVGNSDAKTVTLISPFPSLFGEPISTWQEHGFPELELLLLDELGDPEELEELDELLGELLLLEGGGSAELLLLDIELEELLVGGGSPLELDELELLEDDGSQQRSSHSSPHTTQLATATPSTSAVRQNAGMHLPQLSCSPDQSCRVIS